MATAAATSGSKTSLWAGRILSARPAFFMILTGSFAILKPQAVAPAFAKYSYPDGALLRICVVEIACVIVYLIPSTSVLGTILLTAYFGGAVSTHIRAGEPFFFPIIFAIFVWGGLFLRDLRLRELLPLRSHN